MLVADQLDDGRRRIRRRQRPGRDNDRRLGRRSGNRRDLLARERDERMLVNRLGHGAREQLAIDRKRGAAGTRAISAACITSESSRRISL